MVYSALKGRIGNNLFQIAAGITIAKQNNTDFAAYIQRINLPEPDNCLLKDYLDQFRQNLLRNIVFIDEIPSGTKKYEEPDYTYNSIPYEDNILLDGYFQSEKYFDKKLIIDTFSIDDKTLSYIKSKYCDVLANELTSINIRRGDFKPIPGYHPVCSMKYFNNAINYIGRDNFFLIISDDISWCKKHLRGENYFFIEDESPAVDLYLQTLCNNNIISNSSFSWWGAWLNPNPDKIVIVPSENWVGKYHPVQNTSDLFPPNWVKLANPLTCFNRIRIIFSDLFRILIRIKKSIEKGRYK